MWDVCHFFFWQWPGGEQDVLMCHFCSADISADQSALQKRCGTQAGQWICFLPPQMTASVIHYFAIWARGIVYTVYVETFTSPW